MFSRKADAGNMLMKLPVFTENVSSRERLTKGVNANCISLHQGTVISLRVVILQQESNMQHLQESNPASFSFIPQPDFRGNFNAKCVEFLVPYTGIPSTDKNSNLKILVIKSR